MKKKIKKRGRPKADAEKRGRLKDKKGIMFLATKEEVEALANLKTFYSLKSSNDILRTLLVLNIIDIANLSKDKDWTDERQRAWEYCQTQAREADAALVRLAAKEVIAEQQVTDPNGKSRFTKREFALMTKGKLVEIAEGKGISCVGKRRSGIVKKIMGKQ